jgi:RNA polymerase sigma-70 factor, ECF subfamily
LSQIDTKAEALPVDPEEAISYLMQTYGNRVLHLAYFYVKDRHLAEDITQEVFIKAYRQWDRFRGDSSVYTWLYKITVNLCRDRARSAWWRRLVPTDDAYVLAHGEAQSAPPEEGPEDAALRMAQNEELMAAVMKLSDVYREAIVLYYYQELSTVEIAELTGVSDNTIKTRLFRARAMLKEHLQKGGGGR